MFGIGVSGYEPEELLCHAPPKHPLGRQQGKLVTQVKPVATAERSVGIDVNLT